MEPPSVLQEGPALVEGQTRVGTYQGRRYVWKPKLDAWYLVKKQTKAKITYLDRIKTVLHHLDYMDYDEMLARLGANWDEPRQFNEEYVTTALRKGTINGTFDQMKVQGERNKYKGHCYKNSAIDT